jgi:4-hydroxybenzoate polyprenyltransferase
LQRVASARSQAWTVVGRFASWIALLSIPLASIGVAVAALLGPLALDSMWIVLSLILAVVFLHIAERVQDLAGDRASLQSHRHDNHIR